MPIPDSNRTASLRSCRTQRGHQFLLDDALDGGADPLPHQLLERAFPLPPATAIAFHGVILRHPPPSGRELWLNSPDLDVFSTFLLFYQLRECAGMKLTMTYGWKSRPTRAVAGGVGTESCGRRGNAGSEA